MCPKCKTGFLSRVSINSTNWRCNVCGYTEYRPSSGVDTSSASRSVNSAYSSFNSAADDVQDALRRRKAASREYDRIRKEQKKDSKSGCLAVVIVAIVVYILLNN